MKINKALALFYQFLEQENLLIAWETNFLKENPNHTRASWFAKRIQNGEDGEDFTLGAFTWSKTIEGEDFRISAHWKWISYLNKSNSFQSGIEMMSPQ